LVRTIATEDHAGASERKPAGCWLSPGWSSPLRVSRLAHDGRKDGTAGGLGPRTIRRLHLCLHQALGYAMKVARPAGNPATDAEPPAVPAHTPATLTPQQVGVLLAAAQGDRRPWLRAFVVLAAATGARTGELCGLEWHDLDLDDGTVRFRQALSSIDQQPATGRPRPDGGRGKLLVVGPLKTPASQAALSLPAFASTRCATTTTSRPTARPCGCCWSSPARPPAGRAGPAAAHRARHPTAARAHQPGVPGLRPSRRGRRASHLLRHSLASATAAAREPASAIAGQLRHADGGTLARRTYIHQLPQTPPRLARLIENLYGPAARQAGSDDRNPIESR
jgi:integrase